MAKYTVEIGNKVIELIKDNGYPMVRLIGSLGAGKESNHDIDILIPLTDKKQKQECAIALSKILKAEKHCGQDWGGCYYTNTIFGDVDLFFSTDDFDYGIK